MKTSIKFLCTLLILFAFSCSQETTLDPLPSDLEAISAKANPPSDVIEIGTGNVNGSATIHRSKNGVTVNVKTTGLIAGNAYTMWVVAFNSPQDCLDATDGQLGVDGCDGSDLGRANGDVMYGAGHVVGGNGKGNFSAHLSEGDVSGSVRPQPSPGLIDAQTAEVHIVIKDHGPKIPGMVSEQIHTFNGGCNEGDENEGLCDDVWFAIFLAD